MSTKLDARQSAMLPRFRKPLKAESNNDDAEEIDRKPGHKRNTPEEFQGTFLKAKLKKETGLGDKAEVDAAMARVEFDEKVGKLLTMDKAQTMLEAEHLMWMKKVELLPQDIMREVGKTTISKSDHQIIKKAIDRCVLAMRKEIARGK